MIIVAGGDSFIFGTELKDQFEPNPSSNTFTALLAKKNYYGYSCVAWPGNANNAITRMTVAECELLRSQGKQIAVVISWTYTDRHEFRFNYDTEHRLGPWYSINSWTAESDQGIIDKFAEFFNKNQKGIDQELSHLNSARKLGIAQFAETFYKNTGNNEYYELYSLYKEIVFMQNYLKLHNIPYLFTTADNSFYMTETYYRRTDKFLSGLYKQIDWSSWYFFPRGTQPHETCRPRGFYQWAIENNYEMGISHPLEDAHRDAAELMKEKFDELVTQHNQQN